MKYRYYKKNCLKKWFIIDVQDCYEVEVIDCWIKSCVLNRTLHSNFETFKRIANFHGYIKDKNYKE